MILWPVFEFVQKNRWAQIALLVLAVVFTVGIYLAFRDNSVRQRARAEMEVKIARQNAQAAEKRREITKEIADDAIRADAAVAAVSDVAGPSELRNKAPAVADELLGPAWPSARRDESGRLRKMEERSPA